VARRRVTHVRRGATLHDAEYSGATAVLEEPQQQGSGRRRPVVVTGAAGFVGTHVCRTLVRQGWRVRAFVHDAMKAAGRLADLPVEFRVGDVRDARALESALAGAGAVVHLAAIAIERGGSTYESVNTDATRTLIGFARQAGIRRFVFMSQNGASASSPSRFLRSKGIAENFVRESDLEWTVLRPSVIFGPEDEFVNVLARLARITPLMLPLPDGGKARFQPIAVRDVAAVVALSLQREEMISGSYPLGGPAPLTLRQMTERILTAMRARRAIVGIPRALLRPLIAALQRVVPNPPVTTTLLDLLGSDNVVPDNTLAELGVEPTPFAAEELDYVRRITVRDALGAFFSR
jgi:uncharacterized protein YbjT (DUF2867 family)